MILFLNTQTCVTQYCVTHTCVVAIGDYPPINSFYLLNLTLNFKVLKSEYGLFQNFRLDSSRTYIYWTDRVDLPSDTILEYDQPI